MERFCYCSKILPGKTTLLKDHWKSKPQNLDAEEISFWQHLKITGFECWLQPTLQGDFMIHCLEGESIQTIFRGLRERISINNKIALKLQSFYQDIFDKDYSSPAVEPNIELLMDFSLPSSSPTLKRSFFFPLLPHKEEAHRLFKKEAMHEKKSRHVASMQTFGVSRLSTWLQHDLDQKYIVVYTERHLRTPDSPQERLDQGKNSLEWQEIAACLMDHTGLSYEELSPQVEWLSQVHQ